MSRRRNEHRAPLPLSQAQLGGEGFQRARSSGFTLPRLLKWIGIASIVLVLILASLSFWLLGTESGAHFALARAIGSTEGKLAVERSSGKLAGPLTLEGVRWHDAAAGVDAKVGRVLIDLKLLELLGKRVHITRLDIDHVDVALTTMPPKPAPPASEFSLAAPIDIALDRLALKQAAITQDGKPLFALDSLDLGGAWTRSGAVVKALNLRAPEGSVDLSGTISALAGYPGNGETSFRWKVADVDYAGTLKANGDGRQARLDLNLSEPTPATVAAALTQSRDFPWIAKVAVPRFDPKRVQKGSTLTALALNLEGSGDKDHGALNGEVDVNEHRVQLEPLRYALAGQLLKIEALTLKSPEAAGTLNANGEVQLDAKPVSATLALEWQGVELPADLAGQVLATHGKLNASGSAEKFHADGALAIGPPGKLADLALDLDGTPDLVTLKQLALKQSRAGLDAQGTVKLKPAIGWQLIAKADKFDPGAFAAEWPGALDFNLATDGVMTDKGPDATIELDRLGGTLRKRPISGNADLKIKPDYIVDGTLDIASGKSRVDVTGRGGNQTDATIKLAIASLGDWLPNAGGHLDGEFRAQGKWPGLAVTGTAHGAQIVSGTTQVGTLDVTANIANLQPPQGSVNVKATKISSGSLAFDTLDLDGSGNQQAHALMLDAHGTPLGLKLALSGSAKDDGRWSGTLKTLDVAIKGAPPLALEQPAQLAWDGQQFSATEACLAGGGPKLCVAGSGGADGALAARYRIEQLPIALISKLASPEAPFRADGVIAGNGDLQRAANGALNGNATIHSDQGSVAYPDNANQPLLAYTGLALDAQLSPQSTHATLRATLDHDGKLDGQITLSGAPGSAQALSGHVDLALNSLGFLELLTPEVANTKGRLAANYTIAGTTAAPQLNGALTLKDFATEVPSAGLKLHDGDVTVHATDSEHFTLDGTLKSGEGTLTLSGGGGVGATAPLKASIKGTNFLAADIPAAKVVISPDLTIERSAENIKVGGSIEIPMTNVDLAKLPGGGVAKTSPDVVVTDAEQPAPGKPLPVVVAVTVKLGDDVKLAGLGLDGTIGGQLQIDQRPGKLATGTGTLNVGGSYKAYGQSLKIESGRLLFAGTALDNPGLDVRAVRKILGASQGQGDDTITAGLQIRGTALVPVLTVFSQPAMEQSEALSYLITGKPLSGLKSGEGDMLGSAARALGSAGGDLLAKGIGARMGVDAGVSDNTALGGAAFTVGKYLSPKLYLSYGVGLFTPGEVVTLKYLFSTRWNFEAQNATTGNRAGINYRYER
ncbi:translocation/assembly module TamB domain-containing protein [Dokdonella soli]|uniref:Translocation/assembly module TamB domain-containing protein n=1 Tax=Dokdonella soli TaxID=529810 RepID=A0ABN1IVC2_9GAMM